MHEDYFEVIDTVEKAYWLGFLITDGSVRGNNVYLGLSTKDEIVINKFIESLDIHQDRKYYSYKNDKEKKYHMVTVSCLSAKMVQDLKKFNVVPNKTFICTFPDLNNEKLNLALLSGCFDGDGTSFRSDMCSGNFEFLNQIKNHFNIPYEIRTNKKNVHYLSLGKDLLRNAQKIFSLIERKKIDGEEFKHYWNNVNKNSSRKKHQSNDKSKRYSKCLEEQNLTIDNFSLLVSQHGLKYISDILGCSVKKIKNMCKYYEIHLPNADVRAFNLRKCKRPEKEELLKLLETTSYVQVGKIFGVSDNAVRKWLKFTSD